VGIAAVGISPVLATITGGPTLRITRVRGTNANHVQPPWRPARRPTPLTGRLALDRREDAVADRQQG
jgi:hypothetical protein